MALRKDPKVRKLFKKMMGEKLEKEKKKLERMARSRSRSVSSRGSSIPKTNNKAKTVRNRVKPKIINKPSKGNDKFKSPSDTTLYTAALRKDITSNSPLNRILPPNKNSNQLVEQISNFVERIRVQGSQPRTREGASPSPVAHCSRDSPYRGRSVTPDDHRQRREEEEVERAKNTADKLILDAPQGNEHNVENPNKYEEFFKTLSAMNDDDNYFHVTSHKDDTLKAKIEKGEFVELERFLPKSRTQIMSGGEQHLQQFVKRDGSTYWAPPERESKINNVCRWEQAFRVYASIYCVANPSRSGEIWQYVYVINMAASSYVWENVAYYDFTFRQLMAEKPSRSWAKTYNQLWNLAMCEPLTKSGNKQNFVNTGASSSNSATPAGQHGDWRDRCCWRFSKGNCKSWNCKWDHRCKFCGGWSHSAANCLKKKGNSGGNGNGSSSNSYRPSQYSSRSPSPKPKGSGSNTSSTSKTTSSKSK